MPRTRKRLPVIPGLNCIKDDPKLRLWSKTALAEALGCWRAEIVKDVKALMDWALPTGDNPANYELKEPLNYEQAYYVFLMRCYMDLFGSPPRRHFLEKFLNVYRKNADGGIYLDESNQLSLDGLAAFETMLQSEVKTQTGSSKHPKEIFHSRLETYLLKQKHQKAEATVIDI